MDTENRALKREFERGDIELVLFLAEKINAELCDCRSLDASNPRHPIQSFRSPVGLLDDVSTQSSPGNKVVSHVIGMTVMVSVVWNIFS